MREPRIVCELKLGPGFRLVHVPARDGRGKSHNVLERANGRDSMGQLRWEIVEDEEIRGVPVAEIVRAAYDAGRALPRPTPTGGTDG